MVLKSLCSTLLLLCLSVGVSAQVIYDEAVDGDLSNDNFNPTGLVLNVGSNIVRGTTTSSPLDPDFLSFTIPAGQSLSAVILDTYITTEDQSFFAVEAGPQISSQTSSDNLLGTALIGAHPGAMVGDDVLDDLGIADLGGFGFTPPLTAGTYTFWYQETFASTEYGLDFRIVPEPGAAVLALLGCWSLVRRVR